MTYDLIIVGGGPAGVAAGVYASRKKLRTLFITESFEGQSSVSDGIENWIGTIKISGMDLAKSLENHLKAYADGIVDIQTGVRVSAVAKIAPEMGHEKDAPTFKVTVSNYEGKETDFEGKTVLVATGSKRRKLPIKGADTFEHKGLTYCATCDGPIFADQDVVVAGGGNAAFESAAQLAAYCKTVTIINRGDTFRADPITVEKVSAKENVTLIKNAELLEVKGSAFVQGLVYKDLVSSETKELAVSGIFVEIGLIPNTDFVKEVVELDSYGKVIVDPKTQKTKTAGIWAAGDCTDGLYHQNNIAAGDAVKALEDIYVTLSTR